MADLLDRDFTATAPNHKRFTDFTYVSTWLGFVYVAFVIDCFPRAIAGRQVSKIKDTAIVTTALRCRCSDAITTVVRSVTG